MQSTIAVREFPPSEDFRILVSGELRYGMYCSSCAEVRLALRLITWVRKNRLLFMYWPSRMRSDIRLYPFLTLSVNVGKV
jgi:hypothetical protein